MESKQKDRFIYVDALRGIASLMVFLSHLVVFINTQPQFKSYVPQFIRSVSPVGNYGVQIFFVLSGFVIAHSLRNNSLTPGEVWNFALRRQIRLDPPYWFILSLTIALQIVQSFLPSLKGDAPPTFPVAVANYFYLHDILQWPRIVGLSWTLCLEIQFYILFIGLLFVASQFEKRFPKTENRAQVFLIFTTGVISLAAAFLPVGYNWFLRYWFYFGAGVLSYWAFKGRSKPVFLGFVSLLVVAGIIAKSSDFFKPDLEILAQQTTLGAFVVGLLTCLSLWYAGEKNKMTSWGDNSILQYFGKISYSLYLVHIIIFSFTFKLFPRFIGTSFASCIICCLVAIGVSILGAQLINTLIEKPSMRLASKLKRPA